LRRHGTTSGGVRIREGRIVVLAKEGGEGGEREELYNAFPSIVPEIM